MKFFLPEPPDETFTVEGADASHIVNSLRKKAGDFCIFTNSGIDYTCKIERIERGVITFSVTEKVASKAEPDIKVTLFQAYPKQDKLDLIVEKCTELGIYEIVPFLSKRVVHTPRDFSKKRERLSRIAESAARQSGRGVIPQIGALSPFSAVVESLVDFDLTLFCYENGGERLCKETLAEKKKIALIIGAEGGFSADEADMAKAAGAVGCFAPDLNSHAERAPFFISRRSISWPSYVRQK
jgi:16S rRNA (uracil1498-N3)-methyltransferase